MGAKQKCTLCGEQLVTRFNPMKEWDVEGTMCGKCYSKKIFEYYPGKHVRVNEEQS
ncbi:MAG: hypothetical protein OXC46_09545 [Thaumarchaeota archaeon]|nr:hypothetical protein [Nitrososphaerota archaeon]